MHNAPFFSIMGTYLVKMKSNRTGGCDEVASSTLNFASPFRSPLSTYHVLNKTTPSGIPAFYTKASSTRIIANTQLS